MQFGPQGPPLLRLPGGSSLASVGGGAYTPPPAPASSSPPGRPRQRLPPCSCTPALSRAGRALAGQRLQEGRVPPQRSATAAYHAAADAAQLRKKRPETAKNRKARAGPHKGRPTYNGGPLCEIALKRVIAISHNARYMRDGPARPGPGFALQAAAIQCAAPVAPAPPLRAGAASRSRGVPGPGPPCPLPGKVAAAGSSCTRSQVGGSFRKRCATKAPANQGAEALTGRGLCGD